MGIDNRTEKNICNVMHIDTTNIKNKTFFREKGRAKSGQFPILKENEKTFGTGTGYTASAPGNGDVEPWSYAELELNKYKCVSIKRKKPCPHGPDVGPQRYHGGSGTAAIHYYHLKRQLQSFFQHRGITKRNAKSRRGKRRRKPKFVIQMDKSTCQTINNKQNEKFGYNGILRPKTRLLLDEMELDYAVTIETEIQFTHGFDVNAQDALFHAALKRELRNGPMPKSNNHLQILFAAAAERTNDPRTIQRGFVRAYSRDENGDKNMEMIPTELLDWYSDVEMSSDEEASDDINISSDEEY